MAGLESGNIGSRAAQHIKSEHESELDEERRDSVLKFAGAYCAPIDVPSIQATHETASREILGIAARETEGGASPLIADMRRDDDHARAGIAAKSRQSVSTEGIPDTLAAKFREDEEKYMEEAFRQRRHAAVKGFPRLDSVPYELISSCNSYFNDLHYMQEARSAAFGARGVTMKFCIDRATDMIFHEVISCVADEVDKMLEKETEIIVNKI